MTGFRSRKEGGVADTLVVVRGAQLSEEAIRRDAMKAHRRFGEYGISVLAAPTESALDEIARSVLVRSKS
jgi:hypothetical protein